MFYHFFLLTTFNFTFFSIIFLTISNFSMSKNFKHWCYVVLCLHKCCVTKYVNYKLPPMIIHKYIGI
ncbi:hypothetical protein Lalb_Chr14g0373291 [Lupinus albus]|uniref:Uncharacterized protein n=1 Tax=Lupinus albus TaxID=3870 RepID=A0A6A4PG84_LUPAL|nr:hypothetical protein Lalb_Chr14g0373291 [Lupinus albus]